MTEDKDITTDIKSQVVNINNNLERICPSCSRIIVHTSKCNRDRLDRLKLICKACRGKSQRKYKNVEIFERLCSICGKLTKYKTRMSFNQAEKENRNCFNCAPRPNCSTLTKLKIGAANKGVNNGMFGKTHSDVYKKRLRAEKIDKPLPIKAYLPEAKQKLSKALRKISAEKLLLLGFKGPRVSLNACKFIDEYNKVHDYNFKHGGNGGEFYIKELGYFVDGYDKEKNTIFEYDEKHHFDSITKERLKKDVTRMLEIKELLNCTFIRYNCLTKEIEVY